MTTVTAPHVTGDSIISQYRDALSVIKSVSNSEIDGELILDFTNIRFALPAFVAPISVAYQEWLEADFDVEVQLPRHKMRRSYFNQIGFPEGYDCPDDRYSNHLPIFQLNTNENPIDAVGQNLRELLSEYFDTLSPSVIQTIYYPISEMIANVDEHSNCRHGAVMVQKYKSKNHLDICVVDNGVTIPGSYERFDIDFEDDIEGLKKSLQGISTKADVTATPTEGRSRGTGLRTTSKMVCDGLEGKVLLSSRHGTLLKRSSGLTQIETESLGGTAFVGRLNVPDDDFPFYDYVE